MAMTNRTIESPKIGQTIRFLATAADPDGASQIVRWPGARVAYGHGHLQGLLPAALNRSLCFSAIAAYVVALARLPAQRLSHPIEVPALQAEPR